MIVSQLFFNLSSALGCPRRHRPLVKKGVVDRLHTIFSQVVQSKHCNDCGCHPFVLSNEHTSKATLDRLIKQPLVGDTCIGVSGFFNLDIFALRSQASGVKLRYLVIVDCGLRVEKLWLEFAEKMALRVKTAKEAEEAIYEIVDKNSDLFFDPGKKIIAHSRSDKSEALVFKENLAKKIKKGTSWLSNKKSFAIILDLDF